MTDLHVPAIHPLPPQLQKNPFIFPLGRRQSESAGDGAATPTAKVSTSNRQRGLIRAALRNLVMDVNFSYMSAHMAARAALGVRSL